MKLDLIASTSKSSFNIPIVRIEYIHVLNRQSHTKYLKFMLYIFKFSSVHWGITPPPLPPPIPHTHIKTPLPSFLPSPLLNLQTVQAPFLINPPPYILVFRDPPKNWIFQWTPIFFILNPSHLFKVTKLLFKISQFKFLVTAGKTSLFISFVIKCFMY